MKLRMVFFFIILLLTLFIKHAAVASSVVLAPNMSSCHLPSDLPSDETPFNCCAPSADYPLHLFMPNSSSASSPRVRRLAHLVDEAYAEKLALAYALMKDLPSDDPRSFVQQANIHCAYCNAVYSHMNFSDQLFQVHGSWLFFPFHRWYLYFHERILANLLGDDDFAIPFWNYDHPDGAAIPLLYSAYNLTLVDSLRDAHNNLSSTPAAIDYAGESNNRRSPERQIRENANTMFRSIIRDATSQQEFFGGSYRAGETIVKTYGTVEMRPHNTVHNWLGQKSQVGWKDMGSLYAAARDPVFYAHHALLDRLWEEWKAIPGHYDITDEDYLNAEFAFYNEEAELVRVRVGDALNTTGMGYVYEEVENVWKEAVPERRSVGEAELTGKESMCKEGEDMTGPCTMVMERGGERVAEGDAEEEEYMEVTMEHAANEVNEIGIYINLPSADEETDTGCEEFYDALAIQPGFNARGSTSSTGAERTNSTYKTRSAVLRERLAALELSEAASLVVTLVPRSLNASAAHLTLFNASIVMRPSGTSSHISTT